MMLGGRERSPWRLPRPFREDVQDHYLQTHP